MPLLALLLVVGERCLLFEDIRRAKKICTQRIKHWDPYLFKLGPGDAFEMVPSEYRLGIEGP